MVSLGKIFGTDDASCVSKTPAAVFGNRGQAASDPRRHPTVETVILFCTIWSVSSMDALVFGLSIGEQDDVLDLGIGRTSC